MPIYITFPSKNVRSIRPAVQYEVCDRLNCIHKIHSEAPAETQLTTLSFLKTLYGLIMSNCVHIVTLKITCFLRGSYIFLCDTVSIQVISGDITNKHDLDLSVMHMSLMYSRKVNFKKISHIGWFQICVDSEIFFFFLT